LPLQSAQEQSKQAAAEFAVGFATQQADAVDDGVDAAKAIESALLQRADAG
jgi:hypothetical protein